MPIRRALIFLCLAALLLLATVVLLRRGAVHPPAVRVATAAEVAQARADTLANVARHIYYEEAFGAPNSSAFSLIAALPGLVAGLELHHIALARQALYSVSTDHVVRVRVSNGRHVRVDVGLDFVVAGQRHPFHAPNGAYLGRIEISIQDVIGLIKLFHRLTGADIVVRGNPGHAKSSRPGLEAAALPLAGPVTTGGHTYLVSSFRRLGFAGEPLGIWILLPTS